LLESTNCRIRLPINPSIHQSINPPFDMAEETINPKTARGHRKERLGEVISDKMTKTIVVRVERRFAHPKFKKVVTGYRKFYAHDEKGDAKLGDRVRIEETRPLSKLKRWRLVEIVERSSGVAPGAL
jgi:small subunit ribosomal protein S17